MCGGNAAPRGIYPPIPPPPFLISLSPTDTESHYPSPPFVLHDSLVQFMCRLALSAWFITLCRKPEDGRKVSGEIVCAKKQRAGEQDRPGIKRRRQCVGGRCGILAENRTLVIFSFCHFLCLAYIFCCCLGKMLAFDRLLPCAGCLT